MLALLIALACSTPLDTDTAKPADTEETIEDTGEPVDTDTDTDTEACPYVGEWVVSPCLCEDSVDGSCQEWGEGAVAAIDWDALTDPECSSMGLAKEVIHLEVAEDGTLTVWVEAFWYGCEEGSEWVVVQESTWTECADGRLVTAADVWEISPLGEHQSAICNSAAHLMSAL